VALLVCYVASPLGFTEGGRHYYYDIYLPALAAVVEPIDPWAMTSAADVAAAISDGTERALWLEIGARNASAIRECDVLAAYLEGPEPDSGTVAEVGYAVGLGKTSFGLRSDLREAGEPGMALNLQVEAFIVQSGGAIVSTLDDLVARLDKAGRPS
jgi:nucleoside 2-deoxyribosyltransferase